MRKVSIPTREPSRKVAIAAVCGDVPGVLVQDDQGNQVYVTPKMARELAGRLDEMAGLATGEITEPEQGSEIIVGHRPLSSGLTNKDFMM